MTHPESFCHITLRKGVQKCTLFESLTSPPFSVYFSDKKQTKNKVTKQTNEQNKNKNKQQNISRVEEFFVFHFYSAKTISSILSEEKLLKSV